MQPGASSGEAACTVVPDIRSRERAPLSALGGAEEVLQVFGGGGEGVGGSGAADYCSSFRRATSDFRRTEASWRPVFWIDRSSVQRQEVAGPGYLRSRFEVKVYKDSRSRRALGVNRERVSFTNPHLFPTFKNNTAKSASKPRRTLIESTSFSFPHQQRTRAHPAAFHHFFKSPGCQ